MRGENGAYVQATFDHQVAEDALEADKAAQAQENGPVLRPNPTLSPEGRKGHDKHEADHAPPDSVCVFHVENPLEVVQRHLGPHAVCRSRHARVPV